MNHHICVARIPLGGSARLRGFIETRKTVIIRNRIPQNNTHEVDLVLSTSPRIFDKLIAKRWPFTWQSTDHTLESSSSMRLSHMHVAAASLNVNSIILFVSNFDKRSLQSMIVGHASLLLSIFSPRNLIAMINFRSETKEDPRRERKTWKEYAFGI